VLQGLELLIKFITKFVNSALPLLAIGFKLSLMNSSSQLVLPIGNIFFQTSDFLHQALKLDILLQMKTIVSNEF